MKKIIHLTVFLALISALAGGILASVDAMTRPIIEERKIEAVKASLQAIFPNTSDFKEVTFKDETGLVTNVYQAGTDGYAFNVTVQGYKDIIQFIVGLDMDGKVIGFEVNYVNDTPGLGSKVGDKEFKSSIKGKQYRGGFDTITGATISSSAVLRGIEAAANVFDGLK